jgi:hypothetical protein
MESGGVADLQPPPEDLDRAEFGRSPTVGLSSSGTRANRWLRFLGDPLLRV